MTHVPKSTNTRQRLLHSAAQLFMQNGYHNSTLRDIASQVGVTTGSIFAFFEDKEALLRCLVANVFDNQFRLAEKLIPKEAGPVSVYAVETALQLHLVEQNENLRDLYVTSYSLPTTSESIYQSMAAKLPKLFASTLPGYELKDYYELEIATGSIMRGYMARPCDLYFTIDQKVTRFLRLTLSIYNVPAAQQDEAIAYALSLPLFDTAARLIEDIVQRACEGRLYDPKTE